MRGWSGGENSDSNWDLYSKYTSKESLASFGGVCRGRRGHGKEIAALVLFRPSKILDTTRSSSNERSGRV